MDFRRMWLCLLLSIAMLTTFMPGMAYAGDLSEDPAQAETEVVTDDAEKDSDVTENDNAGAENVSLTMENETHEIKGSGSGENDDYLMDFFSKKVDEARGASAQKGTKLRAAKVTQGSKLSDADALIYEALVL